MDTNTSSSHSSSSEPEITLTKPLSSVSDMPAGGFAPDIKKSGVALKLPTFAVDQGKVPQAPAARPSVSVPSTPGEVSQKLPLWITIVLGVCIFLMGNQVRLPFGGVASKVGISDIALLAGIAVTAVALIIKRRTLSFNFWIILPVVFFAVANCMTASGLGGLVEIAQLAVYLIGGALVFSFAIQEMPGVLALALGVGLLCNLGAACYQAWAFGATVTLAPRDIVELPWGVGQSMTGLFRSKMAFSLYTAFAISWLMPFIWGRLSRHAGVLAAVTIPLVVVSLLLIPNGMILGLTVLALVFLAARQSIHAVIGVVFALVVGAVLACHSAAVGQRENWRKSLSPLKGYDYVADATVLFNRADEFRAENPAQNAHELKTSYYDAVAAYRLAQRHPLAGVGAGNYQKSIGAGYMMDEDGRCAQLPKAAVNDIETDTQAGWGILAVCCGIPAAIIFGLTLLILLGAALAAPCDNAASLCGAGILLIALPAMLVTDPLTRGLAIFLALGMASASPVKAAGRRLSLPRLSLILAIPLLALIAIPIATLSQQRPEKAAVAVAEGTSDSPAAPAPAAAAPSEAPAAPSEAPAPAVAAPVAPGTAAVSAKPAETNAAESDVVTVKAAEGDELYVVFNADKAGMVTMPMRAVEDSAFPMGVLFIPDKAGVPPAKEGPALKYGGCVFQVELLKDETAYMWFNVMWDGSCGNTMDIRVDDETATYTVGNDSTYNEWHWVKLPKTCSLKKGIHRIWVLNREDGIKLGQVLLSNDKEFTPDGIEGDN